MPVTISQLRATIGLDAKEFDQGIKEVNAALAKMGDEAGSAGKKLADSISNMSSRAERDLDKIGNKMSSVGKKLSLGLTVPLTFFGKQAVDVAASFEQNMNVLQAASGATGAQFQQMSALAKALGGDLNLPATSAGDAAAAMLELSKGGLSVADTMAAARSTLQLSAAAQIENGKAAEIVANSLNQFRLAGDQAGRVADLLAGAADSASGGVSDMALALKQSGAAAASAGIPIGDAVTAITALAKIGIKGEDAGTSLKTALIALGKPTTEAAKRMADLHVHAFNARGQFVGLRDLSEQLKEKLGGLTEQQQLNSLATIAGTDGYRALFALMQQGGTGFDSLSAKVNKQGSAAKMAAAQNKGLKGALDAMRSAFETAAQAGIEPIIGDLTRLAKSVGETVNKFSELPQGTRRITVELLAVAAATGPVIIGLGNVVKAIGTIKTAIAAAKAGGGIAGWLASGPVIASIAAIVGAITFLTTAWTQNWGHVQEFTFAVWNTIVEVFQDGAESIRGIVRGLAEVMAGDFAHGAQDLADAGTQIGETFVNNYATEVAKMKDKQANALKAAADAARAAVTAAAQDAPRLPGTNIPGLGLDRKESEATKQHKRFKEQLAEVTIKLAAAQRGESKTSQDLLAQYNLVGKASRDTLIGRQEELDSLNRQMEAQKSFREELTRVNAAIVALKTGGNTALADLAKQFPGLSQAQLGFLANQKEVEKHLGIQAQKVADVNRQIKELMFSFNLLSASTEGGTQPLFSPEQRFAMELYRKKLGELTQAEKDHAAEVFKAQQIAERNSIFVNKFAEEQDNLRLAGARAWAQWRDANVVLDLVTKGSATAMFAWQQFGVILDEVDATTQNLIGDLFRVTETTTALDNLKQSFQGIFTDAFLNVNKGFSGFFQSIMDGVDDLLRQMAAKFLAAQAVKLLFSLVPGGMDFLAGLDAASNIGGARAKGGPVASSQAYLVGENGPEMFVPSRSGRIVPNGQLATAGGGGVVNMSVTINTPDAQSFKRSESEIRASLYRMGKSAEKRNLG